MNDMNRPQPRDSGSRKSQGGNPQSDRSYSRTETGVLKSKLGGTNQQAGSSRQASGSQSGKIQCSESADQPDQSGETGTDENPGRSNPTRGGGAGRAARKPGNQP